MKLLATITAIALATGCAPSYRTKPQDVPLVTKATVAPAETFTAWLTLHGTEITTYLDQMTTAANDAQDVDSISGMMVVCARMQSLTDPLKNASWTHSIAAPAPWVGLLDAYSTAMTFCLDGDLETATQYLETGTANIKWLTSIVTASKP